MLRYEKEAWASGFLRTAGIDEAGRGPLAGPVVAAAVIFEREWLQDGLPAVLDGLTDSKALSDTRRRAFLERLEACAGVALGVGVATVEEIDEINILRATHRAMARAVEPLNADFALVDGLPVKGLPCPSKNIVKGDRLSLSISAASVVAKVTRDRMMAELDERYPGYGFAAHKGYGTRGHLEALRRLGPSPVHRRTFRPVCAPDQLDLGL